MGQPVGKQGSGHYDSEALLEVSGYQSGAGQHTGIEKQHPDPTILDQEQVICFGLCHVAKTY